MAQPKRVYKFLSLKYGIEALDQNHLKVSELGGLNDPFDVLPFDLSKTATRRMMQNVREHFGETTGMISFSKHWHSPLLWAHYADIHKGFALGFDITSDRGWGEVIYVNKPMPVKNVMTASEAEDIVNTKYSGWSYEEEVRMWIYLVKRSANGLHFFDFNKQLVLKEVVVGHANRISQKAISEALKGHPGVRLMKARPAHKEFMMVKDLKGLS